MSKLLQKVQAWRSGREQRALQWWERERVNGRTRFVVRSALTFGLTMAGARDVYDNLFLGGTQYPDFCLTFICYPIVGIFVGSVSWSSWESKYQKALYQALKAPPGNTSIK